MRCTAAILTLTAGTACAAEIANQTVWREENERIVSIYGDLRRDGAFSQPAMPERHWTPTLRLAWDHHVLGWEGGSPAIDYPGTTATKGGIVEQRDELSLLYRQTTGWTWLNIEVSAIASLDDRTDDFSWSDPKTSLVFSLWRDRYHAIAMELGTYHPFGDPENWVGSHGRLDHGGWTPVGGLRGSFGIGMATMHLRGSYARSIAGSNEAQREEVPDGQDKVIAHDYSSIDAAAGVAYRLTRIIRLGVELGYIRQEWRQRKNDGPGFGKTEVVRAPLAATAEFTIVPKIMYLSAYVGQQLSGRGIIKAGESQVGGAALEFVF